MIIGITGGTGCGKTTALEAIRQLGGVVIDCDRVYHRLLQEDATLLHAIGDRFPGCVENGQLLRKKLGALVFADKAALADLNAITGSAIKAEVLRLLESKPKLAAIDAIGLIEGGFGALCDVTVAVTAPREERIQRIMARDGVSREYAQARIDAQKSEAWFRENCGYTLVNDSSEDAFMRKCIDFFRQLIIIDTNPNH